MNADIKELLAAESTYVDFKVSLEKTKPKSWLKTVVAYANGTGGTILFGIDDNRSAVGLEDIHGDAEKISNLIKTKIDPLILFNLNAIVYESKHLLLLSIPPGKMTPYYYVSEGTRTTFVRIGNESVTAPSYIIHELTLKGQRLSFDALSTSERFDDTSFTLFKSTFLKATKKRIESTKDYLSFGMIDKDYHLTYAGVLLADDCSLLQSRIFCTRWSGTSKGSRSIDATDDKEYSGNMIELLKNASSFVTLNSKKSWKIVGLSRIELNDYPENAVREAIVNALVHRDYSIIGSEIHIDIYDDRMEIVSPGGMFDGKSIQEVDINRVASIRRNPIIADIFSRLDYMERRGSGLRRIKDSFQDEAQVEFFSNESNFFVIMKNQSLYEPTQVTHPLTDVDEIVTHQNLLNLLPDNERLVIEYLLQNASISNKQAIAYTSLSPAQIRRIFMSLKSKNMILSVGEGRNRHYILSEKLK